MRALAILLLILMSTTVWAQEATEETNQGELTPLGEEVIAAAGDTTAQIPLVSTWDFVRMLLVLAAVVACIYIIFRLLRRGNKRGLTEHNLIRVIDSRSLSGNRTLHLVEVGRSLYLVGAADGAVSLVSEVNDTESADMVRLAVADSATGGRRSFSDLLAGLFSGPQAGGGPAGMSSAHEGGSGTPAEGGEPSGFVKRQRERLRKL